MKEIKGSRSARLHWTSAEAQAIERDLAQIALQKAKGIERKSKLVKLKMGEAIIECTPTMVQAYEAYAKASGKNLTKYD